MELSVVRWKRYGKDRLYVNDAGGRRIGWYDLQTGESHVDVSELGNEFDIAIADAAREAGLAAERRPECEAPGAVSPQATPFGTAGVTLDRTKDGDPAIEPIRPGTRSCLPGDDGAAACVADAVPGVDERVPGSANDLGHDLAQNRAGALVRAQAKALRDEAPVRTLLARVLGVHTDERAFRVGADGEEKIGARLEKLTKKDHRWRSVHSVPVGERGSDIDHVVVGPAGVFTLNTKYHAGKKIWVGGDTVMVGGHRQPYVRNSRHEARRAGQLLTAAAGMRVTVRGVVVIAEADEMTVKVRPDDVLIMWRQDLVRSLQRLPEVLDEAAIDAIFEVARRSTTWRPRARQ